MCVFRVRQTVAHGMHIMETTWWLVGYYTMRIYCNNHIQQQRGSAHGDEHSYICVLCMLYYIRTRQILFCCTCI